PLRLTPVFWLLCWWVFLWVLFGAHNFFSQRKNIARCARQATNPSTEVSKGGAKYRPVRPPGNASSDNSVGTTHEGRPDPGRPEGSFWIFFIKSAKIRKKPNGSF
ncbi:MAG: hypothetical protein PUE93_04770, partial [Acidaminococcus sp.]|nr:hypothetical protein [Acidaminococcus sp.]